MMNGRLGRVSVVVLMAPLVACGAREKAGRDAGTAGVGSGGSGGGAAGASGQRDGSSDATADARPRLAGNGVPLPPSVSCAELVHVKACDGACPLVTCVCGDTYRALGGTCSGPSCLATFSNGVCAGQTCLTSVSCATACALGLNAPGVLASCVALASCKSGLAPSGCPSGLQGTPCFEDSDCASSACVEFEANELVCEAGDDNAPCNYDQHCQPGLHCVIPTSWDGSCSSGKSNTACLTNADCQPHLDCIRGADRSTFGTGFVCSGHGKGDPCLTNDQCSSGFCVYGRCDTGEAGAACNDASKCQAGLRCVIEGVAGTCTADSDGGGDAGEGADGGAAPDG
jgi:hypothetical protein